MASLSSDSMSPSPGRAQARGGNGELSPGRPPVAMTGARAKSAAAPGFRRASPVRDRPAPVRGKRKASPMHQPGSPSNTSQGVPNSGPKRSVREYRDLLVAIYDKHAPAKNARVDHLLAKYHGQEEYLYRTVCQKYQKIAGDFGPPAMELPSAAVNEADAEPAKGASRANVVRGKAAPAAVPGKSLAGQHAPPPVRTKGAFPKQGSNGEAAPGKAHANGKNLAAGVAAASARLLAEVDQLLLGENTGFFDDPMGDMSSNSDASTGDSASMSGGSSSSGEEDVHAAKLKTAAPKSSATSAPAKSSGLASAPKAASVSERRPKEQPPPPLRERDPPSLRERDPPPLREHDPPPLRKAPSRDAPAEVEKPPLSRRGSAVAEANTAPKSKSAPTGRAASPEPPPLRKAAPPPLRRAPPAKAVETPPVANGDVKPSAEDPEDPEDSDFDDDDLSKALAAGLGKNDDAGKAGSPDKAPKAKTSVREAPPPPLDERRREQRDGDDARKPGNAAPAARPKKDGAPPPAAGASAARSASPPAKAKAAWGAPPPLRDKRDANNGTGGNAARPKGASVAAAPASPAKPVVPKEQPPAPIFDQWLAVLKFLTGWNDQKTYTAEQIKDALCEHLLEEGIENAGTTTKLCNTIVPLLSDVRKTDIGVMKNFKAKEILKGLKIIQIYILRIVTFELIRERDIKATPAGQVKKTKKEIAKDGKPGAPYLAGDISALAKTVQHFRFEGTFSGGLQKLITSIRESKPKLPKVKGDDAKAGTPKQSPGQSPDSGAADTAAATKRKADAPPAGDAAARDKGSTAEDDDDVKVVSADSSDNAKRQRKMV